jgi:hypothetical protein
LAIRTGIAPSVWAAEGQRAIFTALQILRDEEPDPEPDAPQMNG